ncbi:hypothetical protein QLS91_16090 [Flavobacterium sp. LB2P84]|uniref:hypothetical protein n=1 Tax=Flavobacterium yafengii TaxID=3041253 RepID=UPI0024A94B9A|nr:hypothetical protein [Flavobacterium yafengii]MDI6034601.1 hypothetical protein [Flavobacterium yafengii]
MKINLNSPLLKEFFKYLSVFIIGVLVASWFRGCSGSTTTPQIAKFIIPEVEAKFEPKKPVHEPIKKAVVKDYLTTEKSKTVFVENPINKKLIIENENLKTVFAKETDSLKKVIAYNKAIQLNKFSTKFEDENLVLNIDGVVQGEVKEITPNYTVKAKKVEVPVKVKETVFRVLVGGSFGLNKELNQAAYQLDLNFQNRKGNIISAEYLKIGSQEFGMVGYKHSIINIKR